MTDPADLTDGRDPIAADPGRFAFALLPGTQVVTRVVVADPDGTIVARVGAVGVVADVEEDGRYCVRFSTGRLGSLTREQLSLRRRMQETSLGPPRDAAATLDTLLDQHLVFRCLIGSQAYGLARESSDEDRRGIYQAPASMLWSLQGAPDFLERPETEEAYWELKHFVVLALKANPNTLECLYSPIIEHVAGAGHELLAIRDAFLSKLTYQTYNGYVLSQFRKIEIDLRNHGEPKWKHVMHLIRLLLAGISVLRTGTVAVDVGDHRDRLLAIRDNEVPWEQIDAWRLELQRELDEAYATTSLPDLPDHRRVDGFLIDARRAAAAAEDTAGSAS